jgi:formate dehydrogenase gamma subunit
MIHSTNLPQTCGQCHVGASANFTKGKIHLASALTTDVTETSDPAVLGTKIVRWIYIPLIVFVVGGMCAHNLLVWRKKAARKLKEENRTIIRLTYNQRIQHWLLLSSFILLVVSGFALQYPESWLAWLLGSSEVVRRLLHRVAAVIMLLTGAYHVFYLAITTEGRQWVKGMMPQIKDVKDVLQNVAYYLGLRGTKPRFARFGYAEKAEYWAVVWGTIIMGITGLMIWLKIGIFSFLPRWWIEIALSIHFYEAVLATLAIIVWHFYQVIFDPDVYPANFAFLDGRMSEERYKEEHELEFERIKEAERTKAGVEPTEQAMQAPGVDSSASEQGPVQ